MAAKKKENTEESIDNDSIELENFLKKNKDGYYGVESSDSYCISSGSIAMDAKMGGGFKGGMYNFVGATESGKTSAALNVIKNLLDTVPKARALYVKAEGRLGEEMQERSGVRFVFDIREWVDGTCFVMEENIFETVFDFVRLLLQQNREKKKSERINYGIIIDSMDGLMSRNDLEKNAEDSIKVAGGAVMTSDFMRRVSLGMSKFRVIFIPISQVRAKIEVSKYVPQDPNGKVSNSTGGNAKLHYSDFIFEFGRATSGKLILQNPKENMSDDNPPIGHYTRIKICKSSNETTNQIISYPVRYGRTGGTSVWREREIVDWLEAFGLIIKAGAWFSFESELAKEIQAAGIDVAEKYQGMKNLYDAIEGDSRLCDILEKKVREAAI